LFIGFAVEPEGAAGEGGADVGGGKTKPTLDEVVTGRRRLDSIESSDSNGKLTYSSKYIVGNKA
jgi:hypothetical protein